MTRRYILFLLMLVSLLGLTACDSEPPTLMKASKQFESDEIRERHISYMRKNHMDALKHKRDETMYKGIRTQKNSINACINCHIPESYNGKVLRHTDQEHFCTTCHTYVAAKLDCFECHVDHPVKREMASKNHSSNSMSKNVKDLKQNELIDLAFTHSKSLDKSDVFKNELVLDKVAKSRGVSSISDNKNDTTLINSEAKNE